MFSFHFQLVDLNISLEPDFVIHAKLAEVKQKLMGLSEEQKAKIKEVRRKGRNNRKATECRERMRDQTADLQVTQLGQSQHKNYQ